MLLSKALSWADRFEKPERFCSVAGERYKDTFIGQYDENGQIVLKSTGTIDLQEKIQADKYACDINTIVKRYAAGDTDVLYRVQGSFIDVSTMPKSYAEYLNLSIRMKSDFDSLPVDVKANFGNSFENYMLQFGTDDWCKALGIASPENRVEQPVEKLVEKEENK